MSRRLLSPATSVLIVFIRSAYPQIPPPATRCSHGHLRAITTNTYAGRTTAVTIDAPDRDPQTNVTLVDAKGRTVKVWNADNAPTFNPSTSTFDLNSTTASIEYKLDGFGRMRETLLRGQTQTITATYDALGRQTSLDDPDKGGWTYINNALGQVVSQTDAKGNVTTATFDRLARPLTRITAEAASGPIETARWYYFDTAANPDRHLIAQGNKGWIGALQREESITTGAPGHAAATPATTTAYYYDDKGRPQITLRLIDNKWYYTNTAYDQYNRIAQISHFWRPATDEYGGQDPLAWEDFGYTYTYDTRSYLLALHDTTDQARPWWEADATSGYDHLDRPVLMRKGNAHWTQRTYRPEDGVLTNIKTGPTAGATSIQNLTYNFDGLGNLTTRANGGLTETFAYDNLNRLTTRNGATIVAYAINGNITGKTDVTGNTSGNYTYSATKPHAVTNAWGYTMTYDANGNLLTRTGNSETWTTRWTGFDKPRWLAKTGGSSTTGSEFLYNANRSRVMHLEFDAMTNGVPSHYTRKKIYAAGPDVEIDYQNTSTNIAPIWTRDKVRIYINAPDGPVGTAEFTSTSTINLNSPDKALVYHTDHLGSIESITTHGDTSASLTLDDTGKPSRYSYDPWGERRNPDTWSGKPTTTDTGGTDGTASRGFTGHEMLDGLGLAHMNGRIYDPLIGKMLSADPFVQYPGNLQSYNRYSYVLNNPLIFIDPSGFTSHRELGHVKFPGEVKITFYTNNLTTISVFRPLGIFERLTSQKSLFDSDCYVAGYASFASTREAQLKELGPYILKEIGNGNIDEMIVVAIVAGLAARESEPAPTTTPVRTDENSQQSQHDGGNIADTDGQPVKDNEVGQYGNLKERSKGDGKDVDHSPSHASNVLRRERELGRSLTAEEEQELKDDGGAIVRPRESHQKDSRTYGGRNTPAKQEQDADDPEGAIERDIGEYQKKSISEQDKEELERAVELLKKLLGG
jgi:RHS repeat-associated protein